MIENISNNKVQLQLKFVLKNKSLKSKARRTNLKWILLNQLKWILDKLFRSLRGQYQPTLLYLKAGDEKLLFSWFVQVIAGVQAIACMSCHDLLHLFFILQSFFSECFFSELIHLFLNKLQFEQNYSNLEPQTVQ